MIDSKEAGHIVQDYRMAKRPEEQIEIMAQTHATSTAEIRKILYDAGVYKIGCAEIRKALDILKRGGRNHGVANIRSWVSAFQNFDARCMKTLLNDYRTQPWAEPIPEEEFAEALAKKPRAEKEAKPKKEKPVKKENKKKSFSEEERNIILCGLRAMLMQWETQLEEAQKVTAEKLEDYEKVKAGYEAAKKEEDVAAGAVITIERLVERLKEE